MVRRVHDVQDLGHAFAHADLDPLLERDVREPAALAAAAHEHEGGVAAHLEELDESAVLRDRRIDVLVQHGLHRVRDRVVPHRVGVRDAEPGARQPLDPVERGALESRGALGVHPHLEAAAIVHHVVGASILGRCEREPILPAAGPAPRDRAAQREAAALLGGEQLAQLPGCGVGEAQHALSCDEGSSRMSNSSVPWAARSASSTSPGVPARAATGLSSPAFCGVRAR